MLKRLEKFMNSNIYIFLVYLFAFLTWAYNNSSVDNLTFSIYNMIGILTIILFSSVVLALFKNTIYSLPLLTSLLFTVNNSFITFDTLNVFGFPYIALIILLFGPLIHYIRFKPKFRRKHLTLGLFLISIAYLIPLLYVDTSIKSIAISGVGMIYFGFYVFFSNTVNGKIDYFFKILLAINLLLCVEFSYKVIDNMTVQSSLTFLELFEKNLVNRWGTNLGWGNLNDLTMYITFSLPGYIYFIFKKPKHFIYWGILVLPTLVVLLTGSRGGFLGYSIAAVGTLYLVLRYGNKEQFKNIISLILLLLIILIININILDLIWFEFQKTFWGGTLNSFSTNRLWIYSRGIEMFSNRPLFGNGWISIDILAIESDSRLFMYHSTIIHVLATMGLFGLFALIIHYYEIVKLLSKKWYLEVKIFAVVLFAVQVHGLIDNVQFAVQYSFLIAILIPIIENSKLESLDLLVNQETN